MFSEHGIRNQAEYDQVFEIAKAFLTPDQVKTLQEFDEKFEKFVEDEKFTSRDGNLPDDVFSIARRRAELSTKGSGEILDFLNLIAKKLLLNGEVH